MVKENSVKASLETGSRFNITSEAGGSITLDSSEYFGEQNTSFSPMETLLVALAGCMGISVISVMRKKRQDVTSYELRVRGTRAEEHPQVFLEIGVEHIFMGHNVTPEAVARSIELAETRYCSVSAMLGKTAKITNSFYIHEAGS